MNGIFLFEAAGDRNPLPNLPRARPANAEQDRGRGHEAGKLLLVNETTRVPVIVAALGLPPVRASAIGAAPALTAKASAPIHS